MTMATMSIRTAVPSDSTTTEQLLEKLAGLAPGHPDRAALRRRAIVANLPLASRLARRYAGRGERLDDLVQVAALALVKAVDGFDPLRGAPFAGYATPTILGAIKRHFRDTTWDMRVPRSTQQIVLDLPAATDDLAQRHGRYPTVAELADHLHVKAGALRTAVGAAQVYRLPSLNAPHAGDGSGDLIDLLGAADPRFDGVDEQLSHVTLRSLVTALSGRDRRILTLRFRDEMTQAGIAAEIGISQMHVSRLLKQSLARLRAGLVTADRKDGPPARQVRRAA
jgi:RNA polymerase sigma-B factor